MLLGFAGLAGACAADAGTGNGADTSDAGPTGTKSDSGSKTSSSGDSGSTKSSKPVDGKDLVTQLDCGGCHTGNAGELAGNETPVKGTEQYPPNLTPDKDTGLGDWSDDQIAKAIKTGVDDEGAQLCPKMPHFKDLTDEEVTAIVGYLRTLKAVKHDIPESICPPLKTGEPDDAGTTDDGGTVPDDSGTPPPVDSGTVVDAGSFDAGVCASYADPNTTAGCHCDPSLHTCQPNGCYGGYVCLTTTNKCKPSKPTGCP